MPLSSSQPQARVVYCPPADTLIDDFVRQVCAGLGEGYDEPDVVDGFAAFLKISARAQANILNRQGDCPVDTTTHQQYP